MKKKQLIWQIIKQYKANFKCFMLLFAVGTNLFISICNAQAQGAANQQTQMSPIDVEIMSCLHNEIKMPIEPKITVLPEEGSGIATGNLQLNLGLGNPIDQYSSQHLLYNSISIATDDRIVLENKNYIPPPGGFGAAWRLRGPNSGGIKFDFENVNELNDRLKKGSDHAPDPIQDWSSYMPDKIYQEQDDGGLIEFKKDGEKDTQSFFDSAKNVKSYTYIANDQRITSERIIIEIPSIDKDDQAFHNYYGYLLKAYTETEDGIIKLYSHYLVSWINADSRNYNLHHTPQNYMPYSKFRMFGNLDYGTGTLISHGASKIPLKQYSGSTEFLRVISNLLKENALEYDQAMNIKYMADTGRLDLKKEILLDSSGKFHHENKFLNNLVDFFGSTPSNSFWSSDYLNWYDYSTGYRTRKFVSPESRKFYDIVRIEEFGRNTRVTNANLPLYKFTYHPDNLGNLSKITYPDNSELIINYHKVSNIPTSYVSDITYRGETTKYCYYKNGAIKSIIHPDNTVSTYAYGETSASLTITGGGQKLVTYTETFNNKKITKSELQIGSGAPVVKTYNRSGSKVTITSTPTGEVTEVTSDPNTGIPNSIVTKIKGRTVREYAANQLTGKFKLPKQVRIMQNGLIVQENITYSNEGADNPTETGRVSERAVVITDSNTGSSKNEHYTYQRDRNDGRLSGIKYRNNTKETQLTTYEYDGVNCGAILPTRIINRFGESESISYQPNCEIASQRDKLGRLLFSDSGINLESGERRLGFSGGIQYGLTYDIMGRSTGQQTIRFPDGTTIQQVIEHKGDPAKQERWLGMRSSGLFNMESSYQGANQFSGFQVNGNSVSSQFGPVCKASDGRC